MEDCAARETLEEIGIDVRNFILGHKFIEYVQRSKPVRLYIVEGIDEATKFAPISRKEISEICWHRIESVLSDKTNYPLVFQQMQKLKQEFLTPKKHVHVVQQDSIFDFIENMITEYPSPFPT